MDFSQLKKLITEELANNLPAYLTYHNLEHTLGVLAACEEHIARLNIGPSDARLLKTAALFHDTGFMWTYAGHEERSIVFAHEILPEWDYSLEDIKTIAGIIRATKIPQVPHTILEEIIGDADLDYLGTDSFDETSETLYRELLATQKVKNEEEWDRIQVNFISKHHYHTEFAQKYREPEKQKHLQKLLDKWSWKL